LRIETGFVPTELLSSGSVSGGGSGGMGRDARGDRGVSASTNGGGALRRSKSHEEAEATVVALSKMQELTKDERRALRLEIEHLQIALEAFYHTKVVANKVPQSYLFASYERRWRFYKIIGLAQRMVFLAIAMFAPTKYKAMGGAVLMGVMTLASFLARPYADGFEDLLDVTSQASSFVNVLMAVLLQFEKVDTVLADRVMLLSTCAAFGVLAIGLLMSPVIFFVQRLREKALKQASVETARLMAESFSNEELDHLAAGAGAGAGAGGDAAAAPVKG
jgi:hypothetical protein